MEVQRFVHRVGRTARAGNEGISLTIVNEQEMRNFKKMLGKNGKDNLQKVIVNQDNINSTKETISKLENDI